MKKFGRHFICIGVEGNAIIDSASEVFDDIQSKVNMCCRWIVVVCGKEGNDRSVIWPGIGREPVDTPNHTLILFPSSEECLGWHFGLGYGHDAVDGQTRPIWGGMRIVIHVLLPISFH